MQYMLGITMYVLLVGPATYSLLRTAARADAALLRQGALHAYGRRRDGSFRPLPAPATLPAFDSDLYEPYRRN